jgi:hypothetical protein
MAGEKVVELEPRKLLPQDPTGRGFSEGGTNTKAAAVGRGAWFAH